MLDIPSPASHPAVRFLPMRARTLPSVLALAVVVAIAGCAEKQPTAAEQPSASPSASPSPTAEAAPTSFTQPTTCATALPTARIARLEGDRGLVLLGGPDGRYGLEYALDPSPEERAGGITCIWGDGVTDVSAVTVSIAPVTPASRAPIVAQLIDQGLNETVEGDAVVYWQQGDTDEQPAIVNVVRDDSWISVIQTVGGPDAYDEALVLADEAYTTSNR